MLRVNVGLSRKLTHDYNSTGYAINVEGELSGAIDDPHALLEKIREYYDLADEALRDQIERCQSDAALAAHDAPPASPRPAARSKPVNRIASAAPAEAAAPNAASVEQATNKQVQFLLSIGKRIGLSTPQLESRVAEILGRSVGIYDLTKRDAGLVLDRLTAEAPARS